MFARLDYYLALTSKISIEQTCFHYKKPAETSLKWKKIIFMNLCKFIYMYE